MLRKICNYLAVIALSISVAGSTVLANPSVGKNKGGYKTVTVENDKDFHLYKEYLRSGGGKHSYTVKVEAGKEVKIKINASNNISLKIQAPDGHFSSKQAEKFFEIKLLNAGEYVIELESIFLSQYSMEVLSK
jgi:hypothetical protein